jgi:putative hydrolase of the HAD superfamily
MESVVSAVIFDFYGTLAHFADTEIFNYEAVFAAHGYTPERAVLDNYFSRYDGVEHTEHSASEEAYEAWVRVRLRELTGACGVPGPHVEDLVDALRASDQGPMVAYPEAAVTLSALRQAGLAIGVCSNWGWELNGFLDEVGLLPLVDAGVTSARAGSRKPHPDIYGASVSALGVDTADVVFVGDSWGPDVRGPRRIGMTAVHVWRQEERRGQSPPALEPGDYRVGDLTEVLQIVGNLRATRPANSEGIGSPVRPWRDPDDKAVAEQGDLTGSPRQVARSRPGRRPTPPGRRR